MGGVGRPIKAKVYRAHQRRVLHRQVLHITFAPRAVSARAQLHPSEARKKKRKKGGRTSCHNRLTAPTASSSFLMITFRRHLFLLLDEMIAVRCIRAHTRAHSERGLADDKQSLRHETYINKTVGRAKSI